MDASVEPEVLESEEAAPESESAGEIAALIQKLAEAEARAQDLQNRQLRAVADLENYRKRMVREKQETIRSAAAGVIEDLLAPMDNLKLGLQAAKQESGAENLVAGLEMVLQQLRSALSEHGLREIDPQGEDFDPNLHEAVAHAPSEDVPEGKVAVVQRVGYQLNERLLRAASVVVSSGSAAGAGDGESSEDANKG